MMKTMLGGADGVGAGVGVVSPPGSGRAGAVGDDPPQPAATSPITASAGSAARHPMLAPVGRVRSILVPCLRAGEAGRPWPSIRISSKGRLYHGVGSARGPPLFSLHIQEPPHIARSRPAAGPRGSTRGQRAK